MKKYIRKLNRKEGWIAVMLLCLLCTLVFGIWLSSGAWFGDRDDTNLSVTLATIEVDSNTNESLKKTVWTALKNQQILSDDVTFSIAPRSSEFYARIGVFVTTQNATSEVAKDVIKFQGFVPTQNEGYTWVRDGEWYYFCDTNGKPAVLSHKDAGHAFGFMGKESFVMPNNLRPQHYASDDTVELEIRVETVQARNVDDTTPLTLAPFFTTQYPTGNYSVEFRNTDNSVLKAAQVVKYAGDVVAPSVPTVTGKVFQSWNTLIDGTGADVAVEEFAHITQNLVLYPRYKSNEVTVTVVQTSNGEISPGTTTTTYGSDLTFNIKPNGGYEIESITAGGSAIAVKDKNEQEVVLENIVGNTTLTATYSLKSYLISVLSTGDGTTTPSGNQSVKFGEDVLFSFQAGEGKYISSLKIDGIEKISGVTTKTYEHEFLGVSSDHSVDVVYETSVYTISTRVQAFSDGYAYGSISPTSTTCAHGKSVSFLVSAFDGAYISSVKVAGVEQLSGVELSKTNINVAPTENTEVVVTFAPLWKLTQTNSKYYVTEYLGSAQNLVVPNVIYDPATGGSVSVYGVRSLGNNSITSLTLSNGIAYVGGNGTNNIFSATESEIVSVTLPKSVQIIDSYAFLGCNKLTDFVVPTALQQLGAHAFENCSEIVAYDMPKTLLQIGIGAFDGNTSLTQLTFNSTIAPTIADGSIFAGTSSSLAVRVPTSGKASYVSNLSNRSFAEGTYMYPLTGSTPIAKYVNNVFRYIYYVDIINGTGGSSTPSSGRVEVYETQDFSVTFTPSAGNRIEAIYLDSQDTNLLTAAEGDSQTYRFDDGSIKGSHLIEAIYSKMYIRLDINGGTGNQPLVVYNEDRTKFKINSDIEPQKSGKEFYYYSTNKADNEQGQNGTRYDLGLWYDIPNVSISTTLYAIYLTPTTNHTTTQNYVVVPKSVTSISGTSSKNIFGSASDSTLKFITLPRQTTIIGSYALYSCTALTGISYSDGTTQIGDYAFAGCKAVAKFRFSPAITTVGQGAFKDCSALTEATNFDNTKVSVVPNAMFQNCSNLAEITFPTSTISIGDNSFAGCSKIASLDLSKTKLASIGANAFKGCSNVSTIKFPSTLSSIGNGAFQNCSNLTTIYDFDKTKTTSIGTSAFQDCSKLTSIKFPQTLATLGVSAFRDCTALTRVTSFENTQVKILDEYTFEGCSKLSTISFARTLTEIKKGAMQNCTALSSLTSLSSTKLTKIGEYAFAETYALSQMSLPTSYFTIIDANAFENSTIKKITNLKSCTKLKTIGENAFKNAGLTEIEFPACAFEIKSSAFANCAALTKVTFNNATAPTVAENSFEGTTSAVKVFIPNGKIDAYAPTGAGGLHNTGFASGTDSLLTSYTAVDYIQTTGTQYIDTGFVPTINTKVETTFKTSTDGKWLFGSRSSYGSTDTFATHLYSASNAIWFQIAGSSTPQQSVTYSGKKITLTNDKSYMYVDGVKINSTAFTSSSFAKGTHSMYVGGLNDGGTIDSRCFVGQIYSCKIWDNGTLVRDYVPCVRNSDGVAGMFDKVQNKFYTNAGTGAFSTGEANSTVVEEYQRVEYIASSGTQYINTGYYWRSDNARIVLSANVIQQNQSQSLFGNEEYLGTDRYFAFIPHNSDGTHTMFTLDRKLITFSYTAQSDMILDVESVANGQNKTITLNITQGGKTTTYGGQTYNTSGSLITNPNNLDTGVGQIYIFANHNSGRGAVDGTATPNMNATQIVGGMKVYSFKMYDNGTLVRDYVPVVRTSDNAVGLYDLVEGKFYGNAGSGTFSAGAVITPEKAVESGASMHYIGKSATIATCIEDTFKRHFDITMSDATYFVQEDTTRTMEINETLPKGASVQYSWTSTDGRSGTGNTFSAIGVYTVTAKVFGAFYATTKTSAVLTISQASLSGITFMDKTFVYDGTKKSITITGKLPDGATVSYSISGKNGASVDAGATNGTTEVGVYTVTANFGGILAGNTLTATLTITKATKNIALTNKTVTYNGSAHTIDIPTLPNGMTVTSSSLTGKEYNDNHELKTSVSATANGTNIVSRTNAGIYTITVNFSGGRNYNDTKSSATLTINIATNATLQFTNANNFTYDGNSHTITATAGNDATVNSKITYYHINPSGARVENNIIKDAGEYTLTATLPQTQNTHATSVTAVLFVSKANATFTVSTITALSGASFTNAISPASTYSFSSSNSTAVSVNASSGLVLVTSTICNRSGNVTITATSPNTNTATFTIKLLPFVYDATNKAIARYTSSVNNQSGYVLLPNQITGVNAYGSVFSNTPQTLDVTKIIYYYQDSTFHGVLDEKTTYTKVKVADGISTINANAFYAADVSTIELGTGVNSIGANAFYGSKCKTLIFNSTSISFAANAVANMTQINTIQLTKTFSASYALSNFNSKIWRYSTEITNGDWSKTTSTPTSLLSAGYYMVYAENAVSVTYANSVTWYGSLASAYNYAKGKTTTVTIYTDQTMSAQLEITSGTNMTLTAPSSNITIKMKDNITSSNSSTNRLFYITGGTLTIDGEKLIIDGNKSNNSDYYRCIINLQSGSLNLKNGTIQNAICKGGNGGAVAVNGGTFTMSGGTIQNCEAANGGGVCVSGGKFELKGGTIDNCTATGNAGGGVCLLDGTFTMSSGTIQNCTALHGGGVGVDYAASGFTFNMSGGNITSCTATYNGGGIYNGCTTTISGGTINDCSASSGGGIYNAQKFTMSGGTISSCTNVTSGGGIFSKDGSFTMSGGTIYSCSATYGGGVFGESGTVNISGLTAKIGYYNDDNETKYPNTATNGGGVYVAGGTFTLNGKVQYNTATNGGGIYATESSNVSIYGQISNNEATTSGGGIYVKGNYGDGLNTIVELSDGGQVCSNRAKYNGGGIFIEDMTIFGLAADSTYLPTLSDVVKICGKIYENSVGVAEGGAQIWVSAGSNFMLSGSTTIVGEVAFDMTPPSNPNFNHLHQANVAGVSSAVFYAPLVYAEDWITNNNYIITLLLLNLHKNNGGNLNDYLSAACCSKNYSDLDVFSNAIFADDLWQTDVLSIQGYEYEYSLYGSMYGNYKFTMIDFGSQSISGATYTIENNSSKEITYAINSNAPVSLAAGGSVEIVLLPSDYITITATLNGSLIMMGSTMYQGIYVNGTLLVENGGRTSASKSEKVYISNLSSTTIDITIEVK